MTAAGSAQKRVNIEITNVVVVEPRSGSTRRHVDLRDHENSPRGRMNERINTSSRSPPPPSLWATDSTRLDFPGSCWSTYTMKQSARVVLATAAKSYHTGVRSLIVVTARGRMLFALLSFLGSRRLTVCPSQRKRRNGSQMLTTWESP